MAQTLYTKMVGERQVFSYCRTLVINGVAISNPTAQQIADDGWVVYVPPIIPPQPQTEPGMDEVMQAVKRMLSTEADELSDEEALDVAALFPTFVSKIGQSVSAGERLWWDGRLWKAIQNIPELLANWTPDTAVSLFVEVSIVEWPELVVPIPSTSPYMAGDKVTYNGQHYICKMDNCVWTPTDLPSAWELVA